MLRPSNAKHLQNILSVGLLQRQQIILKYSHIYELATNNSTYSQVYINTLLLWTV